jgi:hypothetical protein
LYVIFAKHVMKIKSRKSKWDRYAARMAEITYISVRIPEGKRSLGRSTCRWRIILKYLLGK